MVSQNDKTQNLQREYLFDVKNLVAVITGGGTGIGKIAAHALASNGAKAVYILGRRSEALLECKASSPNPEAIKPIVCDVTSKQSLEAAVQHVQQDDGYCNFLFANAGVAESPPVDPDFSSMLGIQKTLWGSDMEEFQHVFKVNAIGAFYTAIAFLELLAEGNRRADVPQKSQIVFTSSVTGCTRASFGVFAYAASKAALNHIAKQLAGILLPHKIRVNVIVGGFYPTIMAQRLKKSNAELSHEGGMDKTLVPLERSGSEEELAGVVLFLASIAGGYISGTEVVADGGVLGVPPSLVLPSIRLD